MSDDPHGYTRIFLATIIISTTAITLSIVAAAINIIVAFK